MKRLLSSNILLPPQSTGWLRKFPITTTAALISHSHSPIRYELNRLGHGTSSRTNHRLSLKRQLSTQQHDNHFSLLEQYESLIQTGEIARDIHQIDALKELNRLREECISYFNKATNAQSDLESSVSTIFSQLFSSTPSWAYPSTTTPPSGLPRGVYLHGGVGCGKTYCMNLFYNSLPSTIGKQKVHFHKFMLNVHKQMHLAKMKNLQGDDAIEYVIQSTLSKGQILCFDEFQVTDVADGKNMFSSHALLTCM